MWMRCAPISRSAGSVISELQLLVQVVGERATGGDEVLEVGVLAAEGVAGARPQRRPARLDRARRRCAVARRAPLRPFVGVAVDERGLVLASLQSCLAVGVACILRAYGSVALGPVSGASSSRSSSGLRSSSVSTKAYSSMLDSCSSRIACCSWGVITSCWPCLNSNFGESAITAPIVATDVLRGQVISSPH